MVRFCSLLFVAFLTVSCDSASEEDLKYLTGYWEIEEVEMPDGTVKDKDYKINTTIDYFEIKNKKGFRKKVMPQFDGTYLVNDHSEKITVTEEDGTLYLNYATEYAKWKEEIVKLTENELVLRNNHDMEYHYKKPVPFSVK